MGKYFKKGSRNYCGDKESTPYQRAKQVWDERVGTTVVQAQNWRFVAILSCTVAILLLGLLIFSLSMNQNHIFVAEVTSSGRVVNVAPLKVNYQPTVAQEEYFLIHFVKLIRSVPLDPVVAKHNWLTAYTFLSKRCAVQLNQYLQKNNPVKLLGKQTVTVKITDINPISKSSYQINWIETNIDSNGKILHENKFSGVFTISIKQPTTQAQILSNPLGIYIIDFHISARNR